MCKAANIDRLRVGPAGWSYADWRGRVYPAPAASGFDELKWIARFFDLVELNASFYRIPGAKTAESWVARVADHPRFRFSVKLHRSFTHDQRRVDPAQLGRFQEFVGPLVEAGRLGPLLLQFPWSFRPTPEAFDHLARLADALSPALVALELRHGLWAHDEHRQRLEPLHFHPVSIDQPQIGHSLPPLLFADPELLYVRLHGRNTADWFRRDAGRDDRYNYRYSADELREWSTRIEAALAKSQQAYVVTNNHFRGQAVVNGLQIAALLGLDPPTYPASLEEEFPGLAQSLIEAGATSPRPVELSRRQSDRHGGNSRESEELDQGASEAGDEPEQGELFGPAARE